MASLVPRGYLTLNSEDRYPGGLIPRDPSLQTTATDITFSIPALSSITSLQLVNLQVAAGAWNGVVRAENYTNVINVIDYNIPSTFLITIPSGAPGTIFTGGTFTSYVRQQLGDPFATQGSFPYINSWGSNGASGAYDFVNGGSTSLPNTLTWFTSNGYQGTVSSGTYSNHNFGFAPVSSINGINIGGYRQLYDILGLAGHVSSVGALTTYSAAPNQTSNLGSIGYGGSPVQNYWTKFIDIVSPQLIGQPDLSSSPTAPSGLIARITPANASAFNLSTGATTITNTLSMPKIMTIPSGLSTLTIRMYDDKGRPLVPALSTLQTGKAIPLSSLNVLTNNSTVLLYTSTFANYLSVGQPIAVALGTTIQPIYGQAALPAAGQLITISSLSTTATNTVIFLNAAFGVNYPGASSINAAGGTSTLAWYNVGKVSSIGNLLGPEYTAQFAAYSSE